MAKLHFKYQLANTAGYKFNIVKIGYNNYDELAYYHKENFPDIELTRPQIDTDLSLLNDKCILSVNGYIYPTVYNNSRLFIPNATKSMIKSRANNIGIISFNSLNNSLIKYPISVNMITPESPFSLYEKAIITFNEDIKSPILSLCGYMIFENPEFFYRISNRSFVLRLDRLNYIEKLYELNRYRDIFKELNIQTSVNNPTLIDANIARSDAIVLKFLTTFNSFLINVPVDNLQLKKIYLEHSKVPGNFRTEIEPTMPIIVGYGKMSEYLKKKTNDTKFTVYLNDAYYNQHLISNHSFTDINLYNDHRVVGNTYRLTQGYFLDMLQKFK
jgi:hypothetical protein